MKFLFLLLVASLFFINNIHAQCPATDSVLFQVDIIPDGYPEEVSWTLQDSNGVVILSDALTSTTSTYTYSACIPADACLRFTIYDTYGDGICCNYGQGSYEVFVDGQSIVMGGNYAASETTFIACPPGSDCSSPLVAVEEVIYTTSASNTWYTFVPDSTGMYYLTSCLDSNTCGNTTIWVYDYCEGLIWDDTNIGAIAYSDADCLGQFSALKLPLQAGVGYYIRIGYYGTNCTNNSVDWMPTFLGPIAGCTDATACSYNPLATLDDGSCIYPGDPACPDGPDLVVLQGVLASSMYMTTINNTDGCLIEEGCIGGYGDREIIRFTTHIQNNGNADFYIGSPPSDPNTPDPAWEWDLCHGHWHYEGYAEYVMYSIADGTEIPIGFKNGFCVLDLECDNGGLGKYSCGNQGITKQCGDYYSSGLECQWIDITDLEAGQYMLVVRTNWNFAPDALGAVEMDFDNNWAQVCVDITRDPITGAASFTQIAQCDPYLDCEGTVYGSAEYDCNGDCSGVALQGDIVVDTSRTLADLQIYLQECLLDTITATSCLDLNADEAISVVDAALLFDCLLHETNPIPPGHSHTPCDFPYAIYNPNQEVILTLADLNVQDKYVDIEIKNPNGKIIAFEFDISGIEIDYVQNAMLDFNANIIFDDNEILGLTNDESFINKHNQFTPFLRIYYTTINESEICIPSITDFVNEGYETMAHSIDNSCLAIVGIQHQQQNTFSARVIPNPASDNANLIFDDLQGKKLELQVYDITGKAVFSLENITQQVVKLPIRDLAKGIYVFKLSDGKEQSVGRFVVE